MQRGQASLEYVGVVALVAVVLALAAALTAPPDLARSVGTQIRRALCIVAGGDCLEPGGPRACVVRSLERRRDARADVLFLRLSDGRVVLREVRSDGTVQVTVTQGAGAAAAAVLGGRAAAGDRGAELTAEGGAGVRAAFARTFVRPDEASADRLITELADADPPVGGVAAELARLAREEPGDGPVPDRRRYSLGGEVSGEAALGVLGLEASADALSGLTASVAVDTRTGEREVGLRLASAVTARLTAPLAEAGLGLSADASATLTFDRAGRPLRLVLADVRAVRGDVQVGAHRSQGGDRVESEVRLDLTDPAAARDVGLALRGQPLPVARTARRLVRDGRIDVRVYATEREEEGWSAGVGVIASLGAEVVRATERSRLVLAAAREPGQGWARNLDCELAA
jgi:hypothetical protein